VKLTLSQRKQTTTTTATTKSSKDSSSTTTPLKTLGIVELPIQEFADGQAHDLGLPLSWCTTEDAVVNIIFNATIANSNGQHTNEVFLLF
jgi:hypothetical protein